MSLRFLNELIWLKTIKDTDIRYMPKKIKFEDKVVNNDHYNPRHGIV